MMLTVNFMIWSFTLTTTYKVNLINQMLVKSNTKIQYKHPELWRRCRSRAFAVIKILFCYFYRKLLDFDLRYHRNITFVINTNWIRYKERKTILTLKFKVKVNFAAGSSHIFPSKLFNSFMIATDKFFFPLCTFSC